MSFKQKNLQEQFFKWIKNALSAADRFYHKQCSNTDIITNWLMITAKAGEQFKYFQTW